MNKLLLIILLLIIVVYLYKYKKTENLTNTEAVNNIAKVYSDITGTVAFNNANITGLANMTGSANIKNATLTGINNINGINFDASGFNGKKFQFVNETGKIRTEGSMYADSMVCRDFNSTTMKVDGNLIAGGGIIANGGIDVSKSAMYTWRICSPNGNYCMEISDNGFVRMHKRENSGDYTLYKILQYVM